MIDRHNRSATTIPISETALSQITQDNIYSTHILFSVLIEPLPLPPPPFLHIVHYDYVIMGAMASQITSLTIVYPTVYSDAGQTKNKISASLVFVRGIHRGPRNYLHKWPETRKMFPFHEVIMYFELLPWKSKVDVTAEVKAQGHKMGPASCRLSPFVPY